MENLETLQHAVLPNHLDPFLTHIALTTFPTPRLYTVHHNTQTTFCVHPLDLSAPPTTTRLPTSTPVALTLHNDTPLLACRDGALITLENPPEHVGDFTDPDARKSGILAAAASPDGCLLLVVSPASVSILDPDFEVCAELPCDGIATTARAAWRSDGDFFVVLRDGEATTGIVADRAARLLRPLEAVLREGCVAWEPRVGGMLALAQGTAVSFFERNGLPHKRCDFDVGRNVSLLRWSPDARVLLVVGEGVLDVWMKRNYAWYCKKRFPVPDFVDALWDEDDPRLLRVFSEGEVRVLRFGIVPSTCLPVENGPLLAVTHGESVILTNLARGLVPPPMNHGHLTFDAGVESTCCLPASNVIGCLLANGSFETAVLNEPLGKPLLSHDPLKENSIPAIRSNWRLSEADDGTGVRLPFRAPVFITEDVIAVVKQQKAWMNREMPHDEVRIFRIRKQEAVAEMLGIYVTDGQITSICASKHSPGNVTITTSSGSLVRLSVDLDSCDCVEESRTKCKAAENACAVIDTRVNGRSLLSLVHSEEGRLELVDTDMESSTLICDECSSFNMLGDFLVYTTRSNLLYCLPLRNEVSPSEENIDAYRVPIPPSAGPNGDITPSAKGAVRPIDRGSVVVGTLHDDVSVVLQAPRGNLETIVPRPAVLNKIKKLVECENFGSAFALCRRQRIDMNYLVETDLPQFMKNVDNFVSQIGIADHLSVFMTLLTGETSKVNAVCQAVVKALQNSSDTDQYTSAVLTGMMRQDPRDFEGALKQVKRASTSSKENGRAAVDYLFVLVKNQDLIYGQALGTYDLDLASFVAESSQMDPASYHPELTSLRKKEERERRFAIDVKLERYDKALVHLHGAGRKRFQECVSLCLEHSLYDTALLLFQGEQDIMKELLDGYGKYLQTEARFDEAAAVFRQIDDNQSACDCYRLGGRWQLAAYCAASSALPQDEKVVLWNSIATDLEENGRIVESAQVRANFLGEIATALASLVEGEEWDAAFEIAARGSVSTAEDNEKPCDHAAELGRVIVESATCFKGNIDENRRKLEDRGQRLTTVRITKQMMREHLGRKQSGQEADSDMFSESTASSVSNLSDITFYSKTSATSLYSTATQTGPLSRVKLEKKALRRKQRESKKRIREGHPREEEAIVKYVRKLLPTEFTLGRAEKFVRALLFVQKAEVASGLTEAFREYVAEALTLPDDVLGEEKGWLEGVLKDWMDGLPSAMASVKR